MFDPEVFLVEQNIKLDKALQEACRSLLDATTCGKIRWVFDPEQSGTVFAKLGTRPGDTPPVFPDRQVGLSPDRFLVCKLNRDDHWVEEFSMSWSVAGLEGDETTAVEQEIAKLYEAAIRRAEHLGNKICRSLDGLLSLKRHAEYLRGVPPPEAEMRSQAAEEETSEDEDHEEGDYEEQEETMVDDLVDQAQEDPESEIPLETLPGSEPLPKPISQRELRRRPAKKRPLKRRRKPG